MIALTPEEQAAIASGRWAKRHMAQIELATGTTYLWTSDRDVVWQGNTYTGAGDVLSVSELELTGNLEATPFDVVLNGVDEVDRALLFGGGYLFRPVTMFKVYVDENENMLGEPRFAREAELVDAQFLPDHNGMQAMRFVVSDEMEDVTGQAISRQTDAAQRVIDPDDGHYATTPGEIGELEW